MGGLLAAEATVVVALGCVAIYVLRRWGPGRIQGMATASEAEQLLGVARLRKVADIVRPDLYGKHASTSLARPAPSRGIGRGASSAGDPGDSCDGTARPASTLGRGLSGRLTARPNGLTDRRWGRRWGQRFTGSPGGGWGSPWQSVARGRRGTTHDSSGEW